MDEYRRTILRSACVAATAGLSGCLTDTLLGDDGPERVDPDDGRVAWKVAFDAPVRTRPAAGDAVYAAAGAAGVGPNANDETGPLAALDPTDGTVEWHESLAQPPAGHPVPRGGDCYLVTGGHTGLGGVDQRLRRFDSGGDEAWRTKPVDQYASILGFGDGRAYVGTSDDAYGTSGQPLFGVSLPDGTRSWEAESGDAAGGRYHDGRLLVDAAGNALAAHDPSDGHQLWMHDGWPLVDVRGRLVVHGGSAYVERYDGGVAPVDLADGTAGWTFGGDDASSFRATGGATNGDRLVVTEYGGNVFGVDPADGSELWRFRADADTRDEPLLAGDSVFVGDQDGTVYALDADTGEPRWRRATNGAVGTLHLRGDLLVVYVSVKGGSEVIAFDAGDGAERWRYGASTELTRPAVGDEHVYVVDEEEGSVLALG